MKLLLISIAIFIADPASCSNKSFKRVQKDHEPEITFIEHKIDKRIDVMADEKLFTSYRWPDNIFKPVLYPICTAAGTEITRGFPLNPKTGDRIDHYHHVGMWLNYGNVNGNDFWTNGSEGLGIKNNNGGVIEHLSVDKISEGRGEGLMYTTSSWFDVSGEEIIKEFTEYHFIGKGRIRIIDRITTLKAVNKGVSMPDTKEGMFGIRVCGQLELPATGEITVFGPDGQPVKINATTSKNKISGNYMSSEGITGPDVWGTRAKWMNLYGKIGDEEVSLVICDHPKNQNYPTYWHARAYGLFSANPLGVKDFTKGKRELNFSIPVGGSATFRYRVIISSGFHLTGDEINAYADDFGKKY